MHASIASDELMARVISRTQIEAEFKRLDADGDGIITASDLVKASAAGGGACALLGESVALTQDEATSILEELVPADKLMETGEQKLGLNLEQVGGRGVHTCTG